MASIRLQQYQLENENSLLVCWLEADRVKVGDRVTLKDSDNPMRYWTVTKAYSEKDSKDIHDAHESKNWHKGDFHGKLEGLNVGKGGATK